MRVFNDLQEEIEKTLLYSIEENIPLFVESHTSDTAVAAVLNQVDWMFAFSRSLSRTESMHCAVKKLAL